MKQKILFPILQIILVSTLLVGLLLVWAAFQSFETLASLLNNLAADGELESYNLFLYQTLKIPFALSGIGLAILAGYLLLRWEETKRWIQGFPAQIKYFLNMFRQDTRGFFDDVRNAIKGQGWGRGAFLVGTMAIALVMRLGNLDLPLTHDEAYTYNAFASRSVWHIISNYHLPNNHVLLSLMIKIVTVLLGNHVWTLRLSTIIAGVLMVPATYFFAKRFYSVETAMLSSILVALFPVLILYSVLARGYIVIGLITLLLFVLADYVRIHKNCFVWSLIVLFSALGFFTIPIMLFPFGALYIWLIVSYIFKDVRSYETKFDFLKYWVGSGLTTAFITILLYTPIIIFSFDRFFGNSFIAPLERDIFLATTWHQLGNTWIEWTEFVPLWISLLGVFGLLISLIFHKRFSKQKFPPQLAFLIWIVVILVVRRPDMSPRLWLFLTAPLLVWSTAGVIEPLRRIPVRIGKGWNPAQVSVTIIFTFVVAQSFWAIP